MAKILVVDDDELFRDIYADILEEAGHEVILAEDGLAGIEAALANLPDIILMDLNMPGMNGLDAIRALRKEEATKKIPILAATAEHATAIHEGIYDAGGDGYLSKPLDADQLIGRITEVLK